MLVNRKALDEALERMQKKHESGYPAPQKTGVDDLDELLRVNAWTHRVAAGTVAKCRAVLAAMPPIGLSTQN